MTPASTGALAVLDAGDTVTAADTFLTLYPRATLGELAAGDLERADALLASAIYKLQEARRRCAMRNAHTTTPSSPPRLEW